MAFVIGTKRHNFGPHFKNCEFLCHLLSLAQKKIERTQILFRFSTAAHYLIDQLIKFRPYVIEVMKSVFIQQKVACLLDLFQMCSRMTHQLRACRNPQIFVCFCAAVVPGGHQTTHDRSSRCFYTFSIRPNSPLPSDFGALLKDINTHRRVTGLSCVLSLTYFCLALQHVCSRRGKEIVILKYHIISFIVSSCFTVFHCIDGHIDICAQIQQFNSRRIWGTPCLKSLWGSNR